MSKIVLFQTIQYIISTQLSSIWTIDRTLSGDTTPEWTWEWWQWRNTPHSPKLTIRLFRVIFRTIVRGVLPLCRDAVRVFCSLSWLGQCMYEQSNIQFMCKWYNDYSLRKQIRQTEFKSKTRQFAFHTDMHPIILPPAKVK